MTLQCFMEKGRNIVKFGASNCNFWRLFEIRNQLPKNTLSITENRYTVRTSWILKTFYTFAVNGVTPSMTLKNMENP